MNKLKLLTPVLIIIIIGFFLSAFVVDQRKFGVVSKFGEITRVHDKPGLYFKIPLIENIFYFDKRLLMLASGQDRFDTEPVLTKEKQRVVIDWYVRWRIVQPKTYIQNVGVSEKFGEIKLSQLVRDSFQEQVNKYTVTELLATKREELMKTVQDSLIRSVGSTKSGRSWGIEITDVRITRVDYVASIAGEVYKRMQTERQRIANETRSKGAARGEKIRAEADRNYAEIVAAAYRESQIIKGEGDAKANALYTAAFSQDPEFAKFYRNIEAYKNSIQPNQDVMVLDSSSDFFKFLRESSVK